MMAAKIYIFFVSNILFAYLVYHIASIYKLCAVSYQIIVF